MASERVAGRVTIIGAQNHDGQLQLHCGNWCWTVRACGNAMVRPVSGALPGAKAHKWYSASWHILGWVSRSGPVAMWPRYGLTDRFSLSAIHSCDVTHVRFETLALKHAFFRTPALLSGPSVSPASSVAARELRLLQRYYTHGMLNPIDAVQVDKASRQPDGRPSSEDQQSL
jgi:hypothetical protein